MFTFCNLSLVCNIAITKAYVTEAYVISLFCQIVIFIIYLNHVFASEGFCALATLHAVLLCIYY